MNKKQVERWSPFLLLIAIIVIWEVITSGFGVSEFIFPSPSRIWEQTLEHKVTILGHAWRTYWVTMAGFGIAIVVGVLLGFLIGSSRLAYAAVYPLMTAFNALPKAAFVPILVVWFGIGAGPAILTAFLAEALLLGVIGGAAGAVHQYRRAGLAFASPKTRRHGVAVPPGGSHIGDQQVDHETPRPERRALSVEGDGGVEIGQATGEVVVTLAHQATHEVAIGRQGGGVPPGQHGGLGGAEPAQVTLVEPHLERGARVTNRKLYVLGITPPIAFGLPQAAVGRAQRVRRRRQHHLAGGRHEAGLRPGRPAGQGRQCADQQAAAQ